MDEFARAFTRPTSVFVLDIYAASEKPIEGVTARIAGRSHPRSSGIARWNMSAPSSAASRRWLQQARDGDLVLTLGAGNVWQAGDRVLAKLREAA